MKRLIVFATLCFACREVHGEKPAASVQPVLSWIGRDCKEKTRSLHRCVSQKEFEDLWAKLGHPDSYPWTVNFETYMVVGFFLGETRSGIHQSVNSVVDAPDAIRIRCLVFPAGLPPLTANTPPTIETPAQHFLLVVLPRSNKSIKVEKDTSERKSGPYEWGEELATLPAVGNK
ncbi:MAG: hypothetical protein ACJ8C4_01765 [Gemmataceae bacterium]